LTRVSTKLLGFCGALVAIGLSAGAALAQDKEKIVAERQELMKQQGRDMIAIRNFFQGKGEQAQATAAAESLKKSVPTVLNYFPQGTAAGEVTAKTRAKPEIWREHDQFEAAEKKVAAQIDTLDAAVKSGDKARVEAVYNEIKFCDACHVTYRAPAQ
jgi:cytochrome c556